MYHRKSTFWGSERVSDRAGPERASECSYQQEKSFWRRHRMFLLETQIVFVGDTECLCQTQNVFVVDKQRLCRRHRVSLCHKDVMSQRHKTGHNSGSRPSTAGWIPCRIWDKVNWLISSEQDSIFFESSARLGLEV